MGHVSEDLHIPQTRAQDHFCATGFPNPPKLPHRVYILHNKGRIRMRLCELCGVQVHPRVIPQEDQPAPLLGQLGDEIVLSDDRGTKAAQEDVSVSGFISQNVRLFSVKAKSPKLLERLCGVLFCHSGNAVVLCTECLFGSLALMKAKTKKDSDRKCWLKPWVLLRLFKEWQSTEPCFDCRAQSKQEYINSPDCTLLHMVCVSGAVPDDVKQSG
jgi:hypothetical protein